ncbi:MAG: hydrogenase maturation protease [Porticoccaceae bacterium]
MTPCTQPVAPVLVFGWGNPSRGDDALGPMLLEQLDALLAATPLRGVELLTDFQLQVEHALDLVGRQQVLFVDASLNCVAPLEVTMLTAARDLSFSTHAMSPQAVMQVFRDLHGIEPPSCTLLAIRGERFELGEPPSAAALSNLALAMVWCRRWLAAQNSSGASMIPDETAHA